MVRMTLSASFLDDLYGPQVRAVTSVSAEGIMDVSDRGMLQPLGIVHSGATHNLNAAISQHTRLFNITGHPAITIPWSLDPDGLPIGVQLIGSRGSDERVLEIAESFEEVSTWSRVSTPKLYGVSDRHRRIRQGGRREQSPDPARRFWRDVDTNPDAATAGRRYKEGQNDHVSYPL